MGISSLQQYGKACIYPDQCFKLFKRGICTSTCPTQQLNTENDKFKDSMDNTPKYFVKSGFGEDDCSDAVNEAKENPIEISNLFPGTKFTGDMDNFIRIDECIATNYNFELNKVFLLSEINAKKKGREGRGRKRSRSRRKQNEDP